MCRRTISKSRLVQIVPLAFFDKRLVSVQNEPRNIAKLVQMKGIFLSSQNILYQEALITAYKAKKVE